jgi:beta-hydroxyacyl-ACP dehydratase FabZ
MSKNTLYVDDIMKIIPHRYPMIMVDRIEDWVAGERGVGIKNVTINEGFFQGHFPGHPVMPGVLILEAIAQTASVIGYLDMENREKKVVYFLSISNAKFRKIVKPGDQLRMLVKKISGKSRMFKFEGKAYVGDELVTEAEMSAMITDKKEND